MAAHASGAWWPDPVPCLPLPLGSRTILCVATCCTAGDVDIRSGGRVGVRVAMDGRGAYMMSEIIWLHKELGEPDAEYQPASEEANIWFNEFAAKNEIEGKPIVVISTEMWKRLTSLNETEIHV